MSQPKYILPTAVGILFIFGITMFVQEIRRNSTDDETSGRQSSAGLSSKQLEALDYIKGKVLFTDNCKVCHDFFKTDQGFFITGLKNEFWTDTDKIASFLQQPQRFINDPYIVRMMNTFGQTTPHLPFGEITNDEVRMIYRYIMIESERRAF